MDGVISEKEREVIFRKSKELGVPEDECEIILEGMTQKYQKEYKKNVLSEEVEGDDDSEIVIENKVEPEDDHELIRKIFLKDSQILISSIDNKLDELYKNEEYLIEKRNKCDNEFNELLKIYNSLENNNTVGEEVERIKNKMIQNDQELIQLKKDLSGVTKKITVFENEKFEINRIYSEKNFQLFKNVYLKSPIIFQTNIFEKYLQNIKVDNDEQILNLTRFNKFLNENEKRYNENISVIFRKFEKGNVEKKDVDNFLKEKEMLITFYNSFHLMYHGLLKNKMGVYMKIYLELESIGIFNTHFENQVLKNMYTINQHLNQLNETLNQVTKQLSKTNNYLELLNNHMYNLRISIDETNSNLDIVNNNLFDISHEIQNSNQLLRNNNSLLSDIDSSFRFNNLLTGIQTYQMYRINQNTKRIR